MQTADIAKLRTHVHVLEKNKQENIEDKKRFNNAKILFGKVRDSLSDDERGWCEHILFGETREEEKEKLGKKYPGTLLNVIRNRRSVRQWHDAITDKEFLFMVDSARYAPSGCNRQPCEFLLTRDTDKIGALSGVKGQRFIADAPTCIIALADTNCYHALKSDAMKNYFCYMDSGAAIQNLLLTGEYLGLGLCWVNIRPKDEPKIRELFAIPGHYRITAIIPAGTQKGITKTPGKKNLHGMVHYENWNSYTSSHTQ
mgnify:CR=1 FL=1